MYFFEGLENLVVVAWFFWAQIKEFFIENYFEKHHWTKQKAVSWAMYIKIWGFYFYPEKQNISLPKNIMSKNYP